MGQEYDHNNIKIELFVNSVAVSLLQAICEGFSERKTPYKDSSNFKTTSNIRSHSPQLTMWSHAGPLQERHAPKPSPTRDIGYKKHLWESSME